MGDSFGFFLLIVAVGFFGWSSILLGGEVAQGDLLSAYCESQSAQYEIVSGEHYCVKDNQLFQIEWVK